MNILITHAGLIGLLFFFVFFCAMLLWVYRPGAKEVYRRYADIPLKEKKD